MLLVVMFIIGLILYLIINQVQKANLVSKMTEYRQNLVYTREELVNTEEKLERLSKVIYQSMNVNPNVLRKVPVKKVNVVHSHMTKSDESVSTNIIYLPSPTTITSIEKINDIQQEMTIQTDLENKVELPPMAKLKRAYMPNENFLKSYRFTRFVAAEPIVTQSEEHTQALLHNELVETDDIIIEPKTKKWEDGVYTFQCEVVEQFDGVTKVMNESGNSFYLQHEGLEHLPLNAIVDLTLEINGGQKEVLEIHEEVSQIG